MNRFLKLTYFQCIIAGYNYLASYFVAYLGASFCNRITAYHQFSVHRTVAEKFKLISDQNAKKEEGIE